MSWVVQMTPQLKGLKQGEWLNNWALSSVPQTFFVCLLVLDCQLMCRCYTKVTRSCSYILYSQLSVFVSVIYTIALVRITGINYSLKLIFLNGSVC